MSQKYIKNTSLQSYTITGSESKFWKMLISNMGTIFSNQKWRQLGLWIGVGILNQVNSREGSSVDVDRLSWVLRLVNRSIQPKRVGMKTSSGPSGMKRWQIKSLGSPWRSEPVLSQFSSGIDFLSPNGGFGLWLCRKATNQNRRIGTILHHPTISISSLKHIRLPCPIRKNKIKIYRLKALEAT